MRRVFGKPRRVTIAVILAGVIGLAWLAEAVLLRAVSAGIVHAPNAGLSPRVATLAEARELGVDRVLRVDVADPAAVIRAWLIEPAAAPVGTVLVAHGIHSCKRDMLGVGRVLAGAGFRAVLVDLRGHGESTGELLSFGLHESRDLVQVIDTLERENLLAGEVGAYGASFGAATVLQLAGRDARVRAVAAVCPFSSMREIVPGYVRRYIPGGGLLPEFWVQRAVDRAGRLADFDPDDASPRIAARRTNAHVLLIHGRADIHIPFTHSQAIHATAPDRGRLVLVDGEDHASIMQDRSGTISRETIAWFRRWLAAPAVQMDHGGTEHTERN